MAKKKHTFHCGDCGSPCSIYKKGKGHRILVCPKCGVIATNPLPLLALAASTLAPMAIDAAKGLLTKRGKTKSLSADVPERVQSCKMNKTIFDKAVMLEALEQRRC
jgi:hypothetical protein